LPFPLVPTELEPRGSVSVAARIESGGIVGAKNYLNQELVRIADISPFKVGLRSKSEDLYSASTA
jgi:hypothetical protein